MAASQMNRSRWLLGLGLVATASFTVPAVAEPPAASTSNNGLMTFPNVRVENAPLARQAAAKSASSAEGQGMRAAIDPETGQLRPLTADEAKQLSEKPKIAAKTSTGAPRRAAAAAAEESAASGAGQILYGPDNAVGLTLGDDQMLYQVVRKTEEGLVTEEYAGADAAARAVSAHTQKQEVQHGRH